MRLTARIRGWLRSALNRSSVETEMNDELQFHIDQHIERLIAQGIPAESARWQARTAFGPVAARQDEMRDALGLRLIDDLRADLRYAVRVLRQSPAFASVTILSLALGIGANTAIFSLLEAVLWRTAPAANPSELRLFANVSGLKRVYNSQWGTTQRENGVYTSTSFSYAVYNAFTRTPTPFETIFGFKSLGRVHSLIDGVAEVTAAHMVTGSYYRGVGVPPALGRAIAAADDAPNAAPVAVISDTYWRRRFNGNPGVLGRAIVVNDVPLTIVGVNAREFTGLEPGANPDIYFPVALYTRLYPRRGLLEDPDDWWLVVMGRLKPGASETAAQAALQATLTNTVRATLPGRESRDQPALRLLDGSRGNDALRFNFSGRLTILVLLVSLILALACANAASLLMARASVRRREMGLRLALGAGWGRLARQLLSEGMLLALLAGVAGTLLGYTVRNAIPRLLADSWSPPPLVAGFGPRVLLASLAVTLLTGVLFSLAPAWQSRKVAPDTAIKAAARSTSGLGRLRIGKLLVVVQVFLALVIVSGAGLALRTLTNLRAVPLGFDPNGVLLFEVTAAQTRYPVTRIRALVETIRDEAASLPGVESVAFSSQALISSSDSSSGIRPEGRECPHCDAFNLTVAPQFFDTMRIPLLTGRGLTTVDRAGAPRAVVVNREFARRFFPGENALGKTFTTPKPYQIVGISADARYSTLHDAPPPTFYLSAAQEQPEYLYGVTFEVKTAAPLATVIAGIPERLRRLDPEVLLTNVRTQTEQIDATVSSQALFATLTSAFGFLGLMLACVGLYGLMNHSVARRTSEIGIRMALGARANEVLSMVLREAGALVVIGIVLGSVGAAIAARAVQRLLFNVEPYGFLSLAVSALVLLAAAFCAAYWPARRAAHVDPMIALRHV